MPQTRVFSNIPNRHPLPESLITSLSLLPLMLSLRQHGRLYLHRLWSGVHSAAARLRAPSAPAPEASSAGDLRGGRAQRRGSRPALCGPALRAAGRHGLNGGSGRGGLRRGEHSPGVGSQTGPVPLRELALPMSTTWLDEWPLYRPSTTLHFDRCNRQTAGSVSNNIELLESLPVWTSSPEESCLSRVTFLTQDLVIRGQDRGLLLLY